MRALPGSASLLGIAALYCVPPASGTLLYAHRRARRLDSASRLALSRSSPTVFCTDAAAAVFGYVLTISSPRFTAMSALPPVRICSYSANSLLALASASALATAAGSGGGGADVFEQASNPSDIAI